MNPSDLLPDADWVRAHYAACADFRQEHILRDIVIPVSIRKPSCTLCSRRCEPSQLTHGRCGRCNRPVEGYEGGGAGTMYAAMTRGEL